MSQTLAAPAHSEIIIKKSRFIGCVQPMADRASAQATVDALWKQHPGAAHICWALLAGGQSAAVDDGEPGGTAGRPMLDVLRHQDLEGVLATVVRYFGGVKLGAGGLVRAYTEAVALALRGAHKTPIVERLTWCCDVPFAMEGRVRRAIDGGEGRLLAMTTETGARLWWSATAQAGAVIRQRIDDLCSGQAHWCDAPVPDTGAPRSLE